MEFSNQRNIKNRNKYEGCFDSEFHRLSHDLRTPLNHINGFAQLLLMDRGLSPANAAYARAILSGGETLEAAVISYLDRAEEAAPFSAALRKTGSFAQDALCARAGDSSP